jgi:hypothetical protein
VTISRITAEIDELADQILDIGPRPIRVPERPHRVQPTPSARHPSLPTRIVTPGKSKSQQIPSRGVLGPAYLRPFFTSVRTVATLSVPRHSPADGLPLKCAQSALPELTVAKDAVAAPNAATRVRQCHLSLYRVSLYRPRAGGSNLHDYPHPPGVGDVRTCRICAARRSVISPA